LRSPQASSGRASWSGTSSGARPLGGDLPHALEQLVRGEWLGDAGVRTEQHSSDLVQRLSRCPRDKNDGNTKLHLQAVANLVTRKPGQENVDESKLRPVCTRQREGRLARPRLGDRESGCFEELAHEHAHPVVVIDDHDRPSRIRQFVLLPVVPAAVLAHLF
jgi:hypothetical protein